MLTRSNPDYAVLQSPADCGNPDDAVRKPLAGERSADREVAPLPQFTKAFLLHHGVCPLEFASEGVLTVAVQPEASKAALEDLAIEYRAAIQERVVSPAELVSLVERLARVGERRLEFAVDGNDATAEFDADVRDLASQPPVVRYVNLLVRDAFEARASDIHLEANRTGLSARYRVDGILVPAADPPAELQHAVVSRIKLLAELDIAERRHPQDGRIRVRLEERELDLRVSTVPTMYGESVVLRLLDHGGQAAVLEDLGLAPAPLAQFSQMALQPHGLLLVTGPTGSGKTTTLYAALRKRDGLAEKIITVEDPIEYQLVGISQMPVHQQAGVTFGSALRAILRQDPDVIMVGEMRDRETAAVAVQAAMTGHLVLSTLHTNDGLSAVARLRDLGVPDYLIAATLNGVLAQRLVRRVCANCRVEDQPSPGLLARLADMVTETGLLSRGTGCGRCRGTGYRGRIGVFELIVIDESLREAITQAAPRAVMSQLAAAHRFPTLLEDAWAKCLAGLTTVDEVLRVAQA